MIALEGVSMTCGSCGRDVPDGVFCTACGADSRLAPDAHTGGASRRGRYAAHPEEAVFHPGILTTLLPHLDHDRVDEFRWALFAGAAVILVLYLAGLITAALLVAAVLMPLLYVLYLFEVRTYRDAPASVFGLTMGAGILVGAVLTVLANMLRPNLPALDVSPLGASLDVGAFMLTAAAIPVAQELVKPIPALLLRSRAQFDQTIDGFVFGVAAGLGFALAQTIVQFSDVFRTFDVRVEPGAWALPLVTFGVLMPVLHGSTTGIIAAALWPSRKASTGRSRLPGVAISLASAVLFAGGSQVIGAIGVGPAVVVAWQVLVVGGVLLYARTLLHSALIDEAAAFGMRRLACPNCRDEVTASAFCPSCGMALAASAGATQNVRRDADMATGPAG
ncbi:MAG: PrsW family intramembrane metalloprotease [Candidatus Limnocylindrales bacterium]